MGTMWIGKVAGTKDLLRFYFLQKGHGLQNVFLAHRIFFNSTGFIKRQILKMYPVITKAHVFAGSPCFTAADKSLDGTYICSILFR